MTEKMNTALAALKIEQLNEMQKKAIAAAGKNELVLLSPTGTGKTLAFLLPLLDRIVPGAGTQALIITPSRELALQIEQVFRAMKTGLMVTCCYGGHSSSQERAGLENKPELVVGTPGRLSDHLERGRIDASVIKTLVLDEFDKSLELGFIDEMSFIVRSLKAIEYKVLTSATDLEQIPSFTNIAEPHKISFLKDEKRALQGLRVFYLRSADDDKTELLVSLLCEPGCETALIFCNHRDAVARVSDVLRTNRIDHGVFHGKLEQEDRERALIRLRNGSTPVLVTTDLAARGLDIPEISAVIHYQLPATEDVYVHRNGRTARMNAKGNAYLLLAAKDHIPPFISEKPSEMRITKRKSLPAPSPWVTIYIAAGRKEKISKKDIVGMLLQKGKLAKEDLGRIEVADHSSYAAVKRQKVNSMLALIKEEKLKGKKIRIGIAN
jgi:ATP-independent RNA helicase DbpA